MKKYFWGKEGTTERLIFVLSGLLSLITVLSVGFALIEEAQNKWDMSLFFLYLGFFYGLFHLVIALSIHSIRGLLSYFYGDYKNVGELTREEIKALSREDSYRLVATFPERITHTIGVLFFAYGIGQAIYNAYEWYYKIGEIKNSLGDIGTWVTISAFGMALMQIIEAAAKSRLDNRRQEIKLEEMIQESNNEVLRKIEELLKK